jgi:hypothetical protein
MKIEVRITDGGAPKSLRISVQLSYFLLPFDIHLFNFDIPRPTGHPGGDTLSPFTLEQRNIDPCPYDRDRMRVDDVAVVIKIIGNIR